MIEFQEPDEKYEFEQVKKIEGKTRIRVLTILIVFLMFVLMLANNDFGLDVLKTSLVPVQTQCNPLYSYDPEDTEATLKNNAQQVLDQNKDEFQKLSGFADAVVEDEHKDKEGEKGIPPIIRLQFNSVKMEKRMPETICGYTVKVVYK